MARHLYNGGCDCRLSLLLCIERRIRASQAVFFTLLVIKRNIVAVGRTNLPIASLAKKTTMSPHNEPYLHRNVRQSLKVVGLLTIRSIFQVIPDLLQGPAASVHLQEAIWAAPSSVHHADVDLRSGAHLIMNLDRPRIRCQEHMRC